MSPPNSDSFRSSEPNNRFQTTRWTLVSNAQKGATAESRQALAVLCKTYWYPVYVFVRGRGYDREEAEDLTQGFFALLLEKDYLQDARRERGKFRTFLLTAVKHFLSNQRRHDQALKRGGGHVFLPLDFQDAEARYRLEPADCMTPEKAFEKNWALTLLDRALSALRDEMAGSGKQERFERLHGFLTGSEPGLRYRDVASQLQMSESAVKVTVHRMRRRFGQLLRLMICDTLSDPSEADGELTQLLQAMGS